MSASEGADPTIKKITLNPVAAVAEGAEAPNKTRRKGRGRANANKPADPGTKVIVTKDMGSTSTTAAPVAAAAAAPVAAAAAAPTQAAGGATSPGTLVQLASTHVSGSNSSKATGAIAPLTATGAPAGGAAATPVKVVLTQSRKKKVLLAAPKKAAPAHEGSKHKTAKKIHVSLKGLGSGLRRAKTIRKKASKHTLEEIKKALVEAKLIKTESKAPEGILRQMYADYMVLKKKAL